MRFLATQGTRAFTAFTQLIHRQYLKQKAVTSIH
ncbi:hypothetical protein Q31a_05030 [Aureliella helgolandensis]|uniref:Uncharacterized protein n=1 Tax=Aureliella helgolandensis TaxID=2527968 RepID=A0A518G0U5_9BACT|nr:hypothetical protein Q31a_05030 [Aureliella helgolandensis]